MAVKFQEGWQKKSVSQNIRNQGNGAKKAAQAAEKANLSSSQAAGKTTQPQTAKRPVSTGKDAPQTNQAVKPDTQGQQAARTAHAQKASDQMAEVKNAAGKLNLLSTKIATPKNTDSTTTRNPVTAKNDAPQANVKQGAEQPQQPNVANQPAQAKVGAEVVAKNVKAEPNAPKTRDPKKATTKDGQKNTADAKNTVKDAEGAARTGTMAQNAALAGAQGNQPVLETARTGLDDVDADDDGLEEDQDSNSSTFKAGNKPRATKRELGGLLSGFSGEGDSGETDGQVEVAKVDVGDVPELPETDPSLKVFNEFDSEVKDTKYVAEKAQLYIKLVEKRISEIAKLDRELGGKIKDIVETSLSDRIVGELAGELKAADFLQSVYGGLVA